MSEQNKVALLRGLYLAVGTFLSTFFSALLMDSSDLGKAAIIAAIAALSVLGFRGGVEGAYDTNRDRNNIRIPADVTGELKQ